MVVLGFIALAAFLIMRGHTALVAQALGYAAVVGLMFCITLVLTVWIFSDLILTLWQGVSG